MSIDNLQEKLEKKLNLEHINSYEIIEPLKVDSSDKQDNKNQIMYIVPEFAITLNEARQRISMLQEFVKEMMIPGQDYGFIPNCDKPSLYKAGAEKLCDIFGFSKHIEVLNRIEDWNKGLFHYEVKATLINKRSGLIEAEGVGCCNNKEKKYINSPPYSIVNTILKMAKKRAFVDAVLSATRSSGLFSQDLEDFESYNNNNLNTVRTPKAHHIYPVTKKQLNKIQSLVSSKNISIEEIKNIMSDRYKVNESKNLTAQQADNLIKYLLSYNKNQKVG